MLFFFKFGSFFSAANVTLVRKNDLILDRANMGFEPATVRVRQSVLNSLYSFSTSAANRMDPRYNIESLSEVNNSI